MNTFLDNLKEQASYKYTENGALAKNSTGSAVYNLFALGGSYRNRSNEDIILLFKNALEEDETLALKCLFYLRDCIYGQGERRFFRVCYKWLCQNYPHIAKRNLEVLSTDMCRWDDLIYVCLDTPLEGAMMDMVKKQLILDAQCKTPSLLAKWVPSENASSFATKAAARKLRMALGLTSKEYRKLLSGLRTRINIVEKLMSENRWDEIEFDKIPSKAGLKYKNAFARRDIIAKKYEAFAKDKTTKVNATTLYPYEVIAKATKCMGYYGSSLNETDRAMVEKYWENLPDYLNGKECSMMCVVDTSGSMTGSDAAAPINVAISLGLYCAERIGGPFKNHYISFASKPQLIKTEGIDFVDKVRRIYSTNLCDNTNLEAVFDLLLKTATKRGVNPNDIPKTIVVISDMEIDRGTGGWRWETGWTKSTAATEMEKIRQKWAAYGLKLPKLIYWNVDARQNTILDAGPNVSFVSGMSPVIFKQVITGKTGYDLMLDAITAERYNVIR